jgi:hypothetical protein
MIRGWSARFSVARAARSPSTACNRKTTALATPIAADQFGFCEEESEPIGQQKV